MSQPQPENPARFESSVPIEPGSRPERPTAVPPPPPASESATVARLSCPSCGFEQEPAEECAKCGLVIAKFRPRPPVVSQQAAAPPEMMTPEEIAADLADQGYTPRERAVASDAAEDDGFFAPERRGLDKGILGGVIMMGIAVAWFGLGWMAGYIFFYPPILFLIGLFGTLKGLFTGNVAG